MDFPYGTLVTLVSTTTTTDPLGNKTETTVTYEWGPCAVAPRYATESTDPNAPALIVGKTVYGPPLDVDPADLSIKAADRLVIDGEDWQVDGEPGNYTGSGRNPFTGWEPGLEVPVKRVP